VPSVRLKGLNSKTVTTADGRRMTYWYAWRGGPRLEGEPGRPEFIASYNRAVAERRAKPQDTLQGLTLAYKASPEFTRLAASTRAEWARMLDRIGDTAGDLAIGDMPLRALDDRRARKEVLAWRDQWAATPRKADYAIQVLSRVLAFGLDRGALSLNIAAGVSQLYESNRSDQIWTAADIARFQAAAPSPEVGFVVRLAAVTGLRRADLAGLLWSSVGDLAIVRRTGKSRGKRTAMVMILPETRALLEEIRAQQVARHAELAAVAKRKGNPAPASAATVLTNTRGLPWTTDGLEHQVIAVKRAAGLAHLHLHDARGTFITRLRRAGLTASEVAGAVGWDEKRVERLLALYVDQDSIVLALAKRISASEGAET
jgi:integrase